MEHNVFSKAVDSAYQSFDSASTWFNTLTEPIREFIKLKENRSTLSNRCQHGKILSPQYLGKERRTSAPECSLYHVDTTNSNTVFRNWRKPFRGNNFKPEITSCMSLSLLSSHNEYIKTDEMDSSTNNEEDLMNGHPVEDCGVLIKKESLPNICTLISAASDNSLNGTNYGNWINTGSSRSVGMKSKENQSSRNKIVCEGYEPISDIRTVTSCNNKSVYLTDGRPNYLSVSNPDVQRRRSLRVEEEEETIYTFRQRSRTYGSTEQLRSAWNDFRKTDLQSSTSSNDSKRIVPLKGKHTSSTSRRVSICSVTKVSTWHIVSEDNDEEAHSKNYSVYVENVLKSRTERKEHIIPKEVNEASMCSQSNTLVSEDQTVRPPQSVTGSLKVCVQHFETSKTLRVIVLTASNLNAKKGHIYPKITIHYGIDKKKSQTVKLPKVEANSLVVFNAAGFFENVDEAKIEELILKVRLYQKEGVFKSKKCLGELVIPVFKYDLSMDTNIKGKLRHKNSQNILDKYNDYGDDDEELEVLSDDRSISANSC